MKEFIIKGIKKSILVFVILFCVILILNFEVSSRQGVNYQCREIKLPLYLKILDFFDRHYNYKHLVKMIVKDAKTDEERMMKIFEWTYRNIKSVPQGLPVIDDHIWYTIVRGYGARDQFSDIFTTLCNQAGIDAFFIDIYSKDRKYQIPFSFVKINYRWFVFDPYYGVYFRTNNGGLADIENIRLNNWKSQSLETEPKIYPDYALFFSNLTVVKDMGLTRANIQSPLKRLLFELKRRMNF